MAHFAGEKAVGHDGALTDRFDAQLAEWGRNFAGFAALMFGIAAGILVGFWGFGLSQATVASLVIFQLAFAVSFYADWYHRTIEERVSAKKFAARVFLAEFATTIILAALTLVFQVLSHS